MLRYNKGDRRQTLPALSTRAISMDTLDHSASQVMMTMTKWRKMTMMMREMRKSRMMVTLAKRVTRGMMMMRKMKVKG